MTEPGVCCTWSVYFPQRENFIQLGLQDSIALLTCIIAGVVKQQGLIRSVSGCSAQVWTCACVLLCCWIVMSDQLGRGLCAGELFGFLTGWQDLRVGRSA